MDMNQMMGMLSNPNGISQIMMQEAFEDEETGYKFSQADLIADVINILRMDTKRIAEANDVDIEISQMTPERAAELLQGVAQGNDMDIIEIFDEIENKRMTILTEIEDESAKQEYMSQKRRVLYSHPNNPQNGDSNEN